MHLILLSGNSLNNKEWIEKIEQILKPYFESTQIQYYDHWKSGAELINIDSEVEKLIENAKSKEKYIIFAKSAGSLVVSKAIFQNKISPAKCIFVGVPVNWAHKNNFDIDTWFKNFKLTLTTIHHANDPVASTQELESFLKKENVINYNLVEWPGDSHSYNEFGKIKNIVTNLI